MSDTYAHGWMGEAAARLPPVGPALQHRHSAGPPRVERHL